MHTSVTYHTRHIAIKLFNINNNSTITRTLNSFSCRNKHTHTHHKFKFLSTDLFIYLCKITLWLKVKRIVLLEMSLFKLFTVNVGQCFYFSILCFICVLCVFNSRFLIF